MSWPFGKQGLIPVHPDGRRLIGLTLDTNAPIFAPKGHSMMLGASGEGKSISGAMIWLFSLLASKNRPAVLVTDSKDGELFAQTAPILKKYNIPFAVIDPMGVFAPDIDGRMSLNPLGAVIQTHKTAPQDISYAADTVNHAIIAEPPNDARNAYWRQWPRKLIEFAAYVLLKRNPALATPGGVWALIANPEMLSGFAQIEAEEGGGLLKALALNVLEMSEHEHMPQHREQALQALRAFAVGTRLHEAGVGAKLSHFDLIRQKRIIFLVGPQAHLTRLGSLYALHIMAFCNALYRDSGPLTFLNDEFTASPLQGFVDNMMTIRSYGGQAHNIAQSLSEIERKYGKLQTQTIVDNSIVKQWLGFSSFEEAQKIEKAMGEALMHQRSLNSDNQNFTKLGITDALSRQKLMSAAQLMKLPPDQQLIHIKGLGFLIARKIYQNQCAPFASELAVNPQEGGILPPDPIIEFIMGDMP